MQGKREEECNVMVNKSSDRNSNNWGELYSGFFRIAEYIAAYTLILLVIVIFFKFVLMLSPIPSASMENTIMTGDLVISTRFNAKDIERYDVMIFEFPDDPNIDYIKRVIGLPGETITINDGHVYADGVLLDESFINEPMDASKSMTFEVPEDCYFMMGDNRNHSYDSRYWDNTYVPLEAFKAKAQIAISNMHINFLKYSTSD